MSLGDDKEWINFKSSIQKLNDTRIHKVNNSLGVYDAYKWIRKNKWLDIGRCLTEHEFYSIIRRVNEYLADELVRGNDIKLPNRMGRLELRKYDARITFDGVKVKTNLPIDWDRTLRLWYEDEEAFNNKTLIKVEEKEIFKVYYNKNIAKYNNQVFYEFNVNRDIKRRLKQKIKEGKIDAFKL
jgi:nucleoid DNA-binding protein